MTLQHKLSLDLSSFATFWKTSVFLESLVLNWPQCLLSASKHTCYLPTDELLSVHMVMGLSFCISPVFQITNSYFGILTSKQKRNLCHLKPLPRKQHRPSNNIHEQFVSKFFVVVWWTVGEPIHNTISLNSTHLFLGLIWALNQKRK